MLILKDNEGYGGGILAGLSMAEGDILGWTHADLQTNPTDVLKGLALFEEFGSQGFVKGRRYGRPFSEVFFTVAMSVFETLILLKPMLDINAQPTMFSRKFFDSWISPPTDFSIDLYAYFEALRQKQKVYRFPVKFSARFHGVSSWNTNWSEKRKFISRTVEFSFKLRRKLWKQK